MDKFLGRRLLTKFSQEKNNLNNSMKDTEFTVQYFPPKKTKEPQKTLGPCGLTFTDSRDSGKNSDLLRRLRSSLGSAIWKQPQASGKILTWASSSVTRIIHPVFVGFFCLFLVNK